MKTRLLHLSTTASFAGGAETCLANMVELLSDYDHELIYVKQSSSDFLEYFASYQQWKDIHHVISYLNGSNHRCVIMHNFPTDYGLMVAQILKEMNISMAIYIHGYNNLYYGSYYNRLTLGVPRFLNNSFAGCIQFSRDFESRKFHLSTNMEKKKYRELLSLVSVMMVPSQDMKDLLVNKLNIEPDKVTCSPPLLHHRYYTADIEARETVDFEYDILFTGSLTRGKGVKELPGILKKLQDKKRVLIVGKGYLSSYLKKKLGNSIHTIEYKNKVANEDLVNLYSKSKVLVFPSVYDSFGMVACEAAFSGTPIVAYNRGGISDIVTSGYNGFLVEFGHSREFSNCVRCILDESSLLQQMQKNSRNLANKRFSYSIISRRLHELITTLCS